ncbi:hypothetical protein [Nostoc sp.]
MPSPPVNLIPFILNPDTSPSETTNSLPLAVLGSPDTAMHLSD